MNARFDSYFLTDMILPKFNTNLLNGSLEVCTEQNFDFCLSFMKKSVQDESVRHNHFKFIVT